MLEVKKTLKKNAKAECADCNNQEENQIHVLLECSALEQLNLQKGTMENIFSEDIKTLKETVVYINNVMEKYKTAAPPRVELPGNLGMHTKIDRYSK